MKNTLNELQTRCVSTGLQIREGEEKDIIEGVAVVTGVETVLYECQGYREIEVIEPSCIEPDFIAEQDVKANMFHNRETTLARCDKGKGNLTLDTREDGLHFAFKAPDYDLGRRALSMVREGVIKGCSFEFYPQDYEIEERQAADGTDEYVIRHKKFRSLTAVTLALDPAYEQTSVNAREEYREKHPEQNPDVKAEAEKKKAIRESAQALRREASRIFA